MIEVARQPHGHTVTTTARRSHGTAKIDVNQVAELADRLAVVPAAEVHPLAEELDGRLRAEHLERRHVQVVDEEDEVLAERGAEDALAPLVQLRVDEVLG